MLAAGAEIGSHMLCPKTLTGCCDDLCHGSGCLMIGGEMIPTCGKCGGPMMTDDGEPDNSGLICDDCAYPEDAATYEIDREDYNDPQGTP